MDYEAESALCNVNKHHLQLKTTVLLLLRADMMPSLQAVITLEKLFPPSAAICTRSTNPQPRT
jgi:hypothetical protein